MGKRMKENTPQSDFIKCVRKYAMALAEQMEDDDKPKGLVIIASEEAENEGDPKAAMIAVVGDGQEVLDGLVQFATRPETKRLFKAADNMAQLKDFIKEK